MCGDSFEDSLAPRAMFISAAVNGFVDLRCGVCLRGECAGFVESIGTRFSARALTFKGP